MRTPFGVLTLVICVVAMTGVFFLGVSPMSVSARKVADSNGSITINAHTGNTLSITFNEPDIDSGGGSSGGGGRMPKAEDEEEEEEEVVISDLEELLSTVSASELGFSTLSTDKMKAEKTKAFSKTTKLGAQTLSSWAEAVKSSSAKNRLKTLINELGSEKSRILSIHHEVEVFRISTIYANINNYTFRTRVTIKVTPDKSISDIRVLEFIPKSVVSGASELVFSEDEPVVVEDDPLLEWSVDMLSRDETKTFTYYIKSKVDSDDYDDFEGVAVYAVGGEDKTPTGSVIEEGEGDDEEGVGEEGLRVSESKHFAWLWIIVIIVLVGGVMVGVVVYKRKEAETRTAVLLEEKLKPKDLVIRHDLVIPYDKVRQIERFIEAQIRAGKNDVEIKHELLGAGWDEHLIDVIMHDVHVVDNNMEKLDKFIKGCVEKGLTLEQIKDSLLSLGWREDVVDLALDDFR